ncbi:carboxylate-amine ligase [Aeromicrobium endophyticum]|uniref:carboxylate-amine ligase n=1 Tax=Aeromicrobium endophyticum TaxID=2292704 RepID=UPI001314D15B|nr:glutamate--cysteine ligase [Aeromicrobium endophyticum]
MDVRQIGVEEELFLVDPASRRLVAASDRAADPDSPGEVEQELFLQQVEIQTGPHRDLAALDADLRAARQQAALAADATGTRLAATAAPVMSDAGGETTPKQRYDTMTTRFGQVGRTALVCGMHVHVDVRDDDEAVAVVDGLRPWLPLVLALSANSPFNLGADTGYASWRAQVWDAWPSAGPVEPFGSPDAYRRAVEALIASGAALDEGMIYLDARLARRFPTVEVRVADVCTDREDAVVVAAVVRALVDLCARQRGGEPDAEPWRVELLRAARWRASRDGLAGSLIDPVSRRTVAAAEAIGTLLDAIEPALEANGDTAVVRDGVARLLRQGDGAQRQRAAAGADTDLSAVVDDVVRRTRPS